MELPLIERIRRSDGEFFPPKESRNEDASGAFCGAGSSASIPGPLGPGEQYRFHFDMTRCIGCKCCVVACNEQNGNPADILWRRVGEIEGGTYPDTRRHYLSIGCNHCLEPTCLTGCPVDAYSKDPVTGIVLHSASTCIGCQYCTWNCSYGVPQYNPERGVVGKCDMCYGRLQLGQNTACASACPEGAIQIETVRIADWRQEYRTLANSPGMPSADHSISTTRITLPARLPNDLNKVNLDYLRLESPHWPLIVMTVLTQFSVGVFTAIWLMQRLDQGAHSFAALLALFVAFTALSASTLHLGRPIHAARALRMWRRSWLSREVLLFTLFAAAASTYSLLLLVGLPQASVVGEATVFLGMCGVGASARVYLARGRPAWNSPLTFLEFFATAALMGAAGADVLDGGSATGTKGVVIAAAVSFACLATRLMWLALSSEHELYGSWQLLKTVLLGRMAARVLLLVTGVWLISVARTPWERAAAAVLMVAGEFVGRYLFFVSVVASDIASGYLTREAA